MKLILIGATILFFLLVFFIVLLPFLFGVHVFNAVSVVSDRGVFFSSDGGSTWQARNNVQDSRSGISGFMITDFAVDPANAAHLLIGTAEAGVWESVNRGESWTHVTDAARVLDPAADILHIAISRANPKLWFIAVYAKNRGMVLRSEDGGKTFAEVYFVPVERFGVFDVWYDDTTASVFIVTGQGGLLQSRDKGASWRVVKWFDDGIVDLVPDSRSSAVFYVRTAKGRIYKTLDRGENWTDLSSSFGGFAHSNSNQSLTIDPLSGALYLGSDYGLLRSFDGGASWRRVPVIIPPEALPVLAVAVYPGDASAFYISAKSQLYKTTDGGTTWAILPSPTSARITNLVIDKNDPSRIYLVSNP